MHGAVQLQIHRLDHGGLLAPAPGLEEPVDGACLVKVEVSSLPLAAQQGALLLALGWAVGMGEGVGLPQGVALAMAVGAVEQAAAGDHHVAVEQRGKDLQGREEGRKVRGHEGKGREG